MNNIGFYDGVIESELNTKGTYASVTKGVSMSPLFRTNRDMVILVRPERELRRLDVVLYKSPSGKYLLHRIVRVRPDEYIIRGDNTYTPEHVAKGDIIAVLTEFNRKGKRGSVNDIGYRLYSHMWTLSYPARLLYLRVRGFLGRTYRKVFGSK